MPARIDPRVAKARKQKRIAVAGAIGLVVLLVVQVPRTLRMLDSGEAAQAAEPAAEAAAPAPAEAPATEEPAAQTLVSFGRFERKDPFVQQVRAQAPAPEKEAKPEEKAEGAEESGGPVLEEEEAAPTAATIVVNGVAETVEAGERFPAADPMFVLVTVGEDAVTIRVAEGGSFASGGDTLELEAGERITLVNTADGNRYELLLRSVP